MIARRSENRCRPAVYSPMDDDDHLSATTPGSRAKRSTVSTFMFGVVHQLL